VSSHLNFEDLSRQRNSLDTSLHLATKFLLAEALSRVRGPCCEKSLFPSIYGISTEHINIGQREKTSRYLVFMHNYTTAQSLDVTDGWGLRVWDVHPVRAGEVKTVFDVFQRHTAFLRNTMVDGIPSRRIGREFVHPGRRKQEWAKCVGQFTQNPQRSLENNCPNLYDKQKRRRFL